MRTLKEFQKGMFSVKTCNQEKANPRTLGNPRSPKHQRPHLNSDFFYKTNSSLTSLKRTTLKMVKITKVERNRTIVISDQ